MASIDLNSDLGEGWGGIAVANDAAMLGIVSSANLACGYHGGDAEARSAAIAAAMDAQVTIGAHPSYQDREGFGRRPLDVHGPVLERHLRHQLEMLWESAEAHGASVRYLKPHGALYSRIIEDADQADALARIAAETGLPVLGLALSEPSAIEQACDARGVDFIAEVFADRAYTADGTLVSRGAEGAVLTDPAQVAARAARMATDGEVDAIDGSTIRVTARSICVHGDTPGSVALALAVRDALTEAGVELAPFA